MRPDYINAITPLIDQPLVKILAGVRRCGSGMGTMTQFICKEKYGKG